MRFQDIKKYFFLFAAFSVLLFLNVSCNKKDDQSLSKDKINLRYKFAKGDKFSYKLTSKLTNNESIQADSLLQSNSNQTDTYIFDFEVMDVDRDNIAEIEARISFMNVDIDVNGQKFSFRPSDNPPKEEQQKFLQYAVQYNIPFRIRVRLNGEVTSVSNLDKMIDKVLSLQPPNHRVTPELREGIARGLSEEMIHPVVQLIFRELPLNSVGIDSKWEKSYTQEISVFKVNNTAKFALNQFTKINNENVAQVNVNLDVNWEGEKKGEKDGVQYDFDDPEINGNGQYIFSIDKGLVVRSNTSTNVVLSAHLHSTNNLQHQVNTIRMDSSTTKNIIELL